MTLKINGHEVIVLKRWRTKAGAEALIGAVLPNFENTEYPIVGWVKSYKNEWSGSFEPTAWDKAGACAFVESADDDLFEPIKTMEKEP